MLFQDSCYGLLRRIDEDESPRCAYSIKCILHLSDRRFRWFWFLINPLQTAGYCMKQFMYKDDFN